MTQHILVCTEDAVLAKKVRFLLARDECEVEILAGADDVRARLGAGGASLLVLSRQLDGHDALDLLADWSTRRRRMPASLILGGEAFEGHARIRVIPDPIDTQAIYRIASDALASAGSEEDMEELAVDEEAVDLDESGDELELGSLPPAEPMAFEETDDELHALDDADDVDLDDEGLDDGGALAPPPLYDEHDLEVEEATPEAAPISSPPAAAASVPAPVPRAAPSRPAPSFSEPEPMQSHRTSRGNDLGLSGALDTASFAKILYQCWTMEAAGALIVEADDETLTIGFERGAPVHVASDRAGDRLGRTLVQRGRITDSQYGEAAKLAIEHGLSIGAAVVERGFLAEDALGREQGEDARERIVALFAASGGRYTFDADLSPPAGARRFKVPVGRILVEGLQRHADAPTLAAIVGATEGRYFKLRASIEELTRQFPLSDAERQFLSFSGRAYNIADATQASGLEERAAMALMALLTTCEEIDDFTPGVKEFEARLREERERALAEIESLRPQAASAVPAPAPASIPPAPPPPTPVAAPPPPPPPPPPMPKLEPAPPPIPKAEPEPPPPPPPPPPVAAAPPPPPPPPPPAAAAPPTPPPPPVPNPSIPPMPVPTGGMAGRAPREVVFSGPGVRGADGQLTETPERTRSREHFQRGVTLLGQGNFDDAEEAFREAIALCSEEHVYLIGLARALYYNPAYAAPGKVPVLRTIVDRASFLSPDDARVATLNDWVKNAEAALG